MQQAAAPALYDVSVEPAAPEPPGHILDKRGREFVPPKTGLMVRIDKAASERVEVSKATIWAIGVIPVFLAVIFSYGSSAMGWARDDQSQKLQLQQLQNDMTSIKEDIKTMQTQTQNQAIKDAEKRGYELGAVDGKTGHANIKK